MGSSCPEPEVLSALLAGALPEPGRGEAEAHAAECVRCREALLVLSEPPAGASARPQDLERWKALGAPRPRLRRAVPYAAAAGLLLSFALYQGFGRPRAVPEAQGPAAGAPLRMPQGALEGAGATAFLGEGLDLVAEGGLRGDLSGRRLRLDAGRVWVAVSEGEPLTVSLGGTELVLRKGLLEVSAGEAPRAAWHWIAQAQAAESAFEAVVLEGSAEVAGTRRVLRAGERMGPAGVDVLPEEALSRRLEARRRALLASPGDLLLEGVQLDGRTPEARSKAPACAGFRWVTTLQGRGASTEVRLHLPLDGAWREWVAGLAARPPQGTETLEVAVDGRTLGVRIDGRTVLQIPLSRAAGQFPESGRPGWGLSVWGGEVRVERSVLLRLP